MKPACLTLIALCAMAQTNSDWPFYNGTLEGFRYSPLNEITSVNVGQLHEVCSYKLTELPSFETGIIVINGVMYFTTNQGSYAIDAATCVEKWQYIRQSGSSSLANRGFAYLDGKLFRVTQDLHVLALDATSGNLLWDRTITDTMPDAFLSMAPIAWDGMVFMGTAGGDWVGDIGRIYALDENNGNTVWTWDVVPATGPARATWTNPKLAIGGGGIWTSLTLDTVSGVLYLPVGNPAPDFDSIHRTGANLFADSVVALDARTGKLLAYHQVTERDEHDWDVGTPPALVTTRAGKEIIASANKDGLLAVLDRSRISIAETYPPGALPPVIPLLWAQPTTTRLNAGAPLATEKPTHFCPGVLGGSALNGAAYSPQTNMLYTGTVDWCYSIQLVANAGQYWYDGKGQFDPPEAAHGWVTSFDADTGAVLWKFDAPKPILAPVTPTAGGLVFTGDLGGGIYALDAESGKLLWQTETSQPIAGGIVSYSASGHQHIGVAAGIKSPLSPSAPYQSQIIIYDLRVEAAQRGQQSAAHRTGEP